MRYGRERNFGNWPGRGPFSNLPPWERPGYLYGRGTCMYYLTEPTNTAPAPLTNEAEIALLTQQKNALKIQVKAIQQTLEKIQAKLNEKKQKTIFFFIIAPIPFLIMATKHLCSRRQTQWQRR